MRKLSLRLRQCFRSHLLLICALGSAPVPAHAAEHLATELRGGPRVSLAEVLPARHILLGTGLDLGFDDGYVAPGDGFRVYNQRFAAVAGIGRGLQAQAEFRYARAHNSLIQPATISAFGDSELGVRGIWNIVADYYGGFQSSLRFFAGDQRQTDFFDGTSWDIRHVGGYRFGRIHAGYHLGYLLDRSGEAVGGTPTAVEAAAFGLSARDRLTFGLRGDVLLGRFLPYIEYVADYVLGAPTPARRGPQWLALGSGLTVFDGFTVTPGMAFGVVRPAAVGLPRALKWTAQLGIGYRFDGAQAIYRLKQWVRPDPAVLNIDVVDAFRKRAVAAAEIAMYAEGATVTGKGGLRWVGYATRVTYRVQAQYYAPATGAITLAGGRKVTEVVELKPLVGWVRGRVVSPLPDNRAYMVLHDGSQAVSTVVRERFTLPLAPGLYAGFLTAPNAVSRPLDLAVAAGVDLDLGEMVLLARVPRSKRLPTQTNAAGEQVWYFFDPNDPAPSEPEPEPQLKEVGELVGDAQEVLGDIRREAGRGTLGKQAVAPAPKVPEAGGQVGSFAVGETQLTRGDVLKVRDLAELILNDPSIAYVVIEGGADDTGSQAANARISRDRAYSVATELRKYGVPDDKVAIKIEYYVRGTSQATGDARAMERRVAVRILRHGAQ